MMQLDQRITLESRRQFATQTEHLPDDLLATIKPMFAGVETPDFNEGLLAGLSASYQLLRYVPQKDQVAFLGAMIAVVSCEMNKKDSIG